MQSFGLSASQATIVATLQSFAVQPGFNPLQPMANAQSLAVPKKFVAAGDYSDYWFATQRIRATSSLASTCAT
jgi:hypothetical protein